MSSTDVFSITTSGTGNSDEIKLPQHAPLDNFCQDYMLFLTWAGGAGTCTLEVSPRDADTWVPYHIDGTALGSITTALVLQVPGHLKYRLNVSVHTSAATLKAVRVG